MKKIKSCSRNGKKNTGRKKTDENKLIGLVSLFNGISIFVDYLILKQFLKKTSVLNFKT